MNTGIEIKERMLWEKLVQAHPAPWYLEQRNLKGVCVNDNRGNTVFYDDFGAIPDEMPSSQSDDIRLGSTLLAEWLVSVSEKNMRVEEV